jgi:hypothetical protein
MRQVKFNTVIEYSGVPAARAIERELLRLRDEKLFRFLGVTGHTAFESMYRLIDTGLYDQALIAYGYFPKGMDAILSHENLAWRERCLSRGGPPSGRPLPLSRISRNLDAFR